MNSLKIQSDILDNEFKDMIFSNNKLDMNAISAFYKNYFNFELLNYIISNKNINNENKIFCCIYGMIYNDDKNITNKSYKFLFQEDILRLLFNSSGCTDYCKNIIDYYFKNNKLAKLKDIFYNDNAVVIWKRILDYYNYDILEEIENCFDIYNHNYLNLGKFNIGDSLYSNDSNVSYHSNKTEDSLCFNDGNIGYHSNKTEKNNCLNINKEINYNNNSFLHEDSSFLSNKENIF